MKRCELCKSAAMLYCESDQASLCWDCDAKVHSANFLVARHSRSLLCHVCQAPTAWSASGGRLERTVSVCRNCVDGCERVEENREGEEERERVEDNEINTGDDVFGGDEDEEDRDKEEEVSGDDEDGDNQVVPRSSTPPPPATSSSSSEESSNGDDAASVNRSRQNEADLHSDDDFGCSSSHRNIYSPPQPVPPARDSEADVVDSSRRLKRRRIETNQEATVQRGPPGSRTTETVDYLKRFREQDLTSGNDVSTASVGICKLSDNPVAVDFVSSLSL